MRFMFNIESREQGSSLVQLEEVTGIRVRALV